MIKFDVSTIDAQLIDKIADKALTRLPLQNYEYLTLTMDLTATHANGCPLDLERFLAAADDTGPDKGFSFSHDIYGIIKHLDRTTGKLRDCFLPRFARPAPAKASEEIPE